MENYPCKNCICNVDKHCRCEKLTIYETYWGARADERAELLDKVSKRFHSRILFRELTRAELMNIFDDIIIEMKAEEIK